MGNIGFPSRVREYYMDEFLENIKGQVFEEDKIPFCIVPGSNYTRVTKAGALATQAPKVVIDYAMAETAVILPDLLGQIGIETVVFNSSIRTAPPRQEERIGPPQTVSRRCARPERRNRSADWAQWRTDDPGRRDRANNPVASFYWPSWPTLFCATSLGAVLSCR